MRAVMETLAAKGHRCHVLVKMTDAPHRFAGQRAVGVAAARRWTHAGVTYEGVDDLAAALEGRTADRVILYDDALEESFEMFHAAARTGRLVFLAQTIHSLPFGRYSMVRSPRVTEEIKKALAILAPSEHVANYVFENLGMAARVLRPNVFGPGPFAALGSRDNSFVTMINPCAWKGSSIFLNLVRARRDIQFAAVPTWGATPSVMAALEAEPNLTLLPETSNIDEIFARTRILLAPSLCQEAFGLVSPEAMLRGVPVIASAIAGLRESTLGVAKLIPVTPMAFDRPPQGDSPANFIWDEPENPVAPWSAAIDEVMSRYEETSERGRMVATAFVQEVERQPVAEWI